MNTYDAHIQMTVTKQIRVKAKNREEAIEKLNAKIERRYGSTKDVHAMWVPFLEGDQQ